LPASLDRRSERAFVHELEMEMNVERPAVVIDCTQLECMDRAGVHLLLRCLEQAMMRRGDVRLAANAGVMEDLGAWGLDRLFRIFDSSEKAVESFKRRSVWVSPAAASALVSEHAA
jgi:anti-anti-sigma factor